MILIKTIRYFDSIDSSTDYVVNVPNITAGIADIDKKVEGFSDMIAAGNFVLYKDGAMLDEISVGKALDAELIEIYPEVVGAKTSDQEKANFIAGGLLVAAFFTGGGSLAFAQPYLFQAGVLALTYSYTLGLAAEETIAGEGSDQLQTAGTTGENTPIPLVFGRYRAKALRVSMEIDNSRRGEK